MIFLSFEQWQEQQIDILREENPQIDCPICDGEGVISDEDGADACGECDYFGYVEFVDLSLAAEKKYVNKGMYLDAIQNDFSLLASFTGKNEAELYFNNGFIASCWIESKDIFIIQ